MRTSATLDDFTNFHGMLCSPKTAQRCINEFSKGKALFMPLGYEKSSFEPVDYQTVGKIGPLTYTRLGVVTYYLLVIYSLTGLSTLLGWTQFLLATECNEKVAVTKSWHTSVLPDLVVTPSMLHYIIDGRATSHVTIKRQFAYKFGGLVPIRVIMLHIEVDGVISLLEIYHCENWLVRRLLETESLLIRSPAKIKTKD